MGSSHHGAPHEGNPELGKLMERFIGQVEKRAKREYPQGRISGDDEGSLAMAIAADKERRLVIIDFGKPVDWLGLGEKETKGLIQLLIYKLREIATEPFTLEVP